MVQSPNRRSRSSPRARVCLPISSLDKSRCKWRTSCRQSFRVRTQNCKPGIEMNAGGTRQKSAFTLIAVIAIAVAIALFLVLMLVGVQHAKREALKKQCVSNLRDIGISMRGFGIDPIPDSYMMVLGGMHRTPERLGETHRYFLSVTNELRTPNILICPADTKRSPAKSFEALTTANLSYFIGVDSG